MQQASATLASTTIETQPSNKTTTSSPGVDIEKAASIERTDPNPEPPFSTFTHTQKKLNSFTTEHTT